MTLFLEIPADSPAKADFLDWFSENYTKTEEIQGWTFYRWNGLKVMKVTYVYRLKYFQPIPQWGFQ
ncbi:MAG: hypothetical protein JW929_04410 [Anaerolineales bacterium]|nr:hypothetical protein [Anaerolineales bacterium]